MIYLKKIIFSISVFFACLGLILLTQNVPLEVYTSTINACEQVFGGNKELIHEWFMCTYDAAEYHDQSQKQLYAYVIIGGAVAIITGASLKKDKKKCVNGKE